MTQCSQGTPEIHARAASASPIVSNGYELKTLSQASSFSTIDGYLRRASKKLNAIAVVFDNTENGALGDAELAEFVEGARRRFGGRVYILEGERYGRVR